jgi:hypothetical protein
MERRDRDSLNRASRPNVAGPLHDTKRCPSQALTVYVLPVPLSRQRGEHAAAGGHHHQGGPVGGEVTESSDKIK